MNRYQARKSSANLQTDKVQSDAWYAIELLLAVHGLISSRSSSVNEKLLTFSNAFSDKVRLCDRACQTQLFTNQAVIEICSEFRSRDYARPRDSWGVWGTHVLV